MKKRDKAVIGVLLIVGLLIVMLWGVGTGGYLSISEVTSDPQYIGRDVRLIGTVKEGTIQVNLSETSFVLTDGSADINVIYIGEKVDLTDGEGVVVIGTLVTNEKIEARKIIMRCPTMYVGAQPSRDASGANTVLVATSPITSAHSYYLSKFHIYFEKSGIMR